jgi:hypothetical protein
VDVARISLLPINYFELGHYQIFEQELPEFLKRKPKEPTKELRKSTFSLALGVTGVFPLVGNVATALSLLSSSREVFVNLNQTLRSRREIDDYDLSLKNKERMLRQVIEKSPISEKAVLLDTLDLLVNTISTRIKL